MPITHQQQKEIWEKEHSKPLVLPQMDSSDPSGGVVLFWQWLKDNGFADKNLKGIEMGCGKGRNCIWLKEQGVQMTGFDFSENAIKEAHRRADVETDFIIHDATMPWPWPDNSFDLAIDCWASTDIESKAGRDFARGELKRVLRPSGLFLVYTLSTDDKFHKEMIAKSPSDEKNSFLHEKNGKFEKSFTEEEIKKNYQDWRWLAQRRISKKVSFFGKEYDCRHWWLVLQKI